MSLTAHQVDSVIQAYLRNMATKAADGTGNRETPEDVVLISHEALRAMFFKRIGKLMTDRLKRREARAVERVTQEP